MRPSPVHELSMLKFQEMFADARSMAIVGSSSSVDQWDNGEYIDSHDVVVRFNRATTRGQEKQVGSRTDLLVANEGNGLHKAPSPADTVNPRCVVTYLKTSALGSRNTRWHAPLFEWVGDIPLLVSTGPEIDCCDVPRRRRGFSMGTYAVASLPYWLSIEKLFVTGFTLFGAVPGGAHHYCKKPTRVSVTWHDADLERTVFGSVLGALPCSLVVTDEVAKLMEAEGFHASRLGEPMLEQFATVRRSPATLLWYLAERFSKSLLTTGYMIRRTAERRMLASR